MAQGSIPGQGIKIPQAMWPKKKKKKNFFFKSKDKSPLLPPNKSHSEGHVVSQEQKLQLPCENSKTVLEGDTSIIWNSYPQKELHFNSL